MAATIKELWVYPVKACRGVQVQSATLTPTGFEYDRAWCVVDVEGTHVAKLEAISQRKVPALATVQVGFEGGEGGPRVLCLDAPGMPQLRLPTEVEAYETGECPELRVECSGKSTTTGGGWSLGFIDCRQHPEGSAWINTYLNRPVLDEAGEPTGKMVHGKRSVGKFAIARSLTQGVELGGYPPIFPLIERAKTDPEYKARFEGNAKRFSDFAPFLLVSRASARFLATACKAEEYPIASFRGNIVVDGEGLGAWAEETWKTLEVAPADGGGRAPLVLRKIKECPRCTVPCRDQATGKFLFPSDKLKMWSVLKRVFPRKYADAEWGTWSGAFFGVYMGHHGQEGEMHVGDTLLPRETQAWDAHLPRARSKLLILLAVAAAAAAIGLAAWLAAP